MNDAFEAIGVALGIAMVLGIPFGFFAFLRYLRFKETIALAEQGLLRPAKARTKPRHASLGDCDHHNGHRVNVWFVSSGI